MEFRPILDRPVSLTCNRDLRVDPYGTRGTCSTFACECCGKQTPLVLNEVPPPCVSPPNIRQDNWWKARRRGQKSQYSQEFDDRFKDLQ